MRFDLITPDALRSVWPQVRAGLDKMPPEEWIPEDVYHEVKSGRAALHVGRGAQGGFRGFVVLRRLVDEFSGRVSCHVWLAFNAGGGEEYGAALSLYREVARRMGADRITFGSPRTGWAKRFRQITTTYEIPMQEDAP